MLDPAGKVSGFFKCPPPPQEPRGLGVLNLTLDGHWLPFNPRTVQQNRGFVQAAHFQLSSSARTQGACRAELIGERGTLNPGMLLNLNCSSTLSSTVQG